MTHKDTQKETMTWKSNPREVQANIQETICMLAQDELVSILSDTLSSQIAKYNPLNNAAQVATDTLRDSVIELIAYHIDELIDNAVSNEGIVIG